MSLTCEILARRTGSVFSRSSKSILIKTIKFFRLLTSQQRLIGDIRWRWVFRSFVISIVCSLLISSVLDMFDGFLESEEQWSMVQFEFCVCLNCLMKRAIRILFFSLRHIVLTRSDLSMVRIYHCTASQLKIISAPSTHEYITREVR
jgi:hypothetical protein